MNEEIFLQEVKEIELINQSLRLLEWDSQTGMPQASSTFRGEVVSYLSSLSFERSIGEKIQEGLAYFEKHPEQLSEVGMDVYKAMKKNYELNHSVPIDEMKASHLALNKAHVAWLKARENKDFSEMFEEIQSVIMFLKKFIPYWRKNEKTDYDVLLNQYEPNLTVEKLDRIFEELKQGIMEIRETLLERGTAPKTDFLTRKVTKEQQKKFIVGVVEQLGYDFSKGRLDDTIHPFMTGLNRKDARITTRWDETSFSMAIFGVIHEAGHGIYEQNIDEKYDYTPLSAGASMGIHESQSLFNEIIIGSKKAFWQKQYPFFKECVEGTFDDISFEDFYASLKETKASLIRIEADSLTYPLHIIIRYEIEKMIFNEDISLDELPKIWNEKYQEYLGICPKNDLEGIVQDIHWASGSFGYFPSYALGYMYAAQLYATMDQELDVDAILASDDYLPIKNWLTTHIHQYGASKKPNQLIFDATGEELTPKYLIEYMKEIYYDVYKIND